MSKSNVAAAILTLAGVGLLGFSIGRFLGPETDYQAYEYKPPPQAPAYTGERPVAKFAEPLAPGEAALTEADAIQAALDEVLNESDPFARANQLVALVSTLGPEAVPVVRDMFLKPTAFDRDGLASVLLVQFWATYEPREAAQAVLFGVGHSLQLEWGAAAIEVWALQDPEAAETVVAAHRTSPAHHSVLSERALVKGWFDSGLPGLEDYIHDLGPGFEQQRALAAFTRRAIQVDGPEAVARWAEAIPDEDGDFKLNAFRRVGREFLLVDPAAATAWCEAHCEGPFGDGVQLGIARRWAALDGEAMMAWLSSAPESLRRSFAVLHGYRAWLEANPVAAIAYIEALGIDGIEDWLRPAINTYSVQRSLTDPAQGLEWARLIAADSDREFTMISILQRWRNTDPEAADAWIESSPLSEEARAQARTAPGGPPRPAGISRDETPKDLNN